MMLRDQKLINLSKLCYINRLEYLVSQLGVNYD